MRFRRDKRGYENFYLVETSTNRRGKTRARVLYWFRTPPGVKIGREPFDGDVRRALEQQYPDVAFDWRKISETPIPSADAERWRERRRLEKAERARLRESPAPARELPAEAVGDEPDVNELEDTDSPPDEVSELADADGDGEEEEKPVVSAVEAAIAAAQPSEHAVVDPPPEHGVAQPPRESSRRRRRRRRRGRPRPDQAAATGQAGSNEPSAPEGAPESRDPSKPDEV